MRRTAVRSNLNVGLTISPMRKESPKRLLLAALRAATNSQLVGELPALETGGGRSLLRWMDRSGLALYFWRELLKHGADENISSKWRNALQKRLADNTERTVDMRGEFRRVVLGFQQAGVKAIALKGFSLVPDFCEEAPLRHQTDFDFLVAPEDVNAAAETLRSGGYTAEKWSELGETCFTTPMSHIPSTEDYLYLRQQQRQVDLHVSLWEPSPWLKVETPADSLSRAECRTLEGTKVWCLPLADSFLNQVLHVFRHSMRSWIRLSWLLELGRCIDLHRADTRLWDGVREGAGESELLKKVFAFVLGLVNRVFEVRMPSILERWTGGTNTAALEAWIGRFGLDWATTDWPGSLKNLFIAEEFIHDPGLRMQYYRSRLLPRMVNASIGVIAAKGPRSFATLQVTRAKYLAQRTAVHMRDVFELPLQGWRWRRAAEAARREAR